MLETGRLCSDCIGGKCHDSPSKESALLVQCPNCNGKGCDDCGDGDYEVTECPYHYCGGLVELSHLSGLWEQGLPPVAGGVFDQSAWFVSAHRYFTAQKNGITAKEVQDGKR